MRTGPSAYAEQRHIAIDRPGGVIGAGLSSRSRVVIQSRWSGAAISFLITTAVWSSW